MQVSWIDPDELNSLARQLLDPTPPSSQHPEVQPLPDASVLAAESLVDPQPPAPNKPPVLELEHIRAKLRNIRDRAQTAGLLPTTPTPTPQPPQAPVTTTPAPPPPIITTTSPTPPAPPLPQLFQPLDGTIAERLSTFGSWAIKQINSEDLLILDHHSDILWGIPSRENLLIQSTSLIERTNQSNPSENPFPKTTTLSGKTLSIIPTNTRYGKVNIVTLTTTPPTELTLQTMRDTLTIAINGARIP